jgi:Arc/MetJ-type ribon-helix-helix transcriptional regulator
MTQFVTRLDPDLAGAVDALVEAGVVESRSDAVRRALEALVDRHRRAAIAQSIVDGYSRIPQLEDGDDVTWPDAATIAMIGEESW